MSSRAARLKRIKGNEILGNKCARCGETDHKLLTFDHIRRDTKLASPHHLTWDLFFIEIKKCQLLCRFCHEQKSAMEDCMLGNIQHCRVLDCTHGRTGYRRGCRCDACVAAEGAATRAKKKRRAERAQGGADQGRV